MWNVCSSKYAFPKCRRHRWILVLQIIGSAQAKDLEPFQLPSRNLLVCPIVCPLFCSLLPSTLRWSKSLLLNSCSARRVDGTSHLSFLVVLRHAPRRVLGTGHVSFLITFACVPAETLVRVIHEENLKAHATCVLCVCVTIAKTNASRACLQPKSSWHMPTPFVRHLLLPLFFNVY